MAKSAKKEIDTWTVYSSPVFVGHWLISYWSSDVFKLKVDAEGYLEKLIMEAPLTYRWLVKNHKFIERIHGST